MKKSSKDLWLVRNPGNHYSRPIGRKELLNQITKGQVVDRAQICAAGGYWFSLSNTKEVREHLGRDGADAIQKCKQSGERTLETSREIKALKVVKTITDKIYKNLPGRAQLSHQRWMTLLWMAISILVGALVYIAVTGF